MTIIDELHATDVAFHGGNGEDIFGLKDLKREFSEIYSAFPDLHHTIGDIVAKGTR